MQPPTAPPRDTLTQAQVVALIQDAEAIHIGAGCELLDSNLAVLDDLTPDLVGGSVTRTSYANMHGTATLGLSRRLDWGQALVRPYLTLSDRVTTATFRLGVYRTNAPTREMGEDPNTYAVQCVDILSALGDLVGDAYAVAAGTSYLTAVERILTDRGVAAYLIDRDAAAAVLPADRVWIFDDKTRWLGIVNDLLGAIGYAGAWSDWDGRIRCHRYISPTARSPEWVYNTGIYTSMLAPNRSMTHDIDEVPNRWVFYRQNDVDNTAPVEGNGLYTYVNQYAGLTSVSARARTITRVVGLDAADHPSLVAAAQVVIDADMRVATSITAETAPNPLHWHFDRCYVVDPAVGPPVDILSTRWTLPLDGGNQTHEWTVLQ